MAANKAKEEAFQESKFTNIFEPHASLMFETNNLIQSNILMQIGNSDSPKV